MSTAEPNADETIVVKERLTPRGCAWRFGCVAVWLPLILLPLCLFVIAVQGEVALWHGPEFPESAEHPFLQAKLQMDIDTRGLNITRSYVSSSNAADTAVCVQTSVRFVLWQGDGPPVDYCDCYRRSTAEQPWTFDVRMQGLCGQAQ
jgi:hypothetical protein